MLHSRGPVQHGEYLIRTDETLISPEAESLVTAHFDRTAAFSGRQLRVDFCPLEKSNIWNVIKGSVHDQEVIKGSVYLIKQDKGSVYLKGGRYKIIHWFSTTLTPWFALVCSDPLVSAALEKPQADPPASRYQTGLKVMQAQLAEHLRLEVHVLHVPRSLIRFVLPKGETMKTQATRLVHPILLIIAITSGSMAVARGDGGRTPDSVQNVERAKALLDSWSGQQDVLRDAMKLIMRAIGQNNEYPPAYLEYARYQLKSGYLSAKEVGSGPNTYMLAQYKPGTLGMARRTLQRALAIDPGYADGYILLGHIEFSNRRPDKAREALAIADSLASTTNPWQDLYWADVLLAEGDYEGAVSRYRTVAESDTENLKALLAANEGLIRHYTWRGDYAAADTTFTRMVALSPENAWLRGNYATFLTGKLGRYDDAIEQASEALRIMDYGVGRQILAFALYRKWAEVLATPGSTPENPQEYFDVASQLYPDLTQVMVYSASNNHGENLAKALIAKGISVDAAVGNGSTALQIAANTGRHEVVSYLLGLGADPNVSTTNGWTPLLGAADEGDYETVRLLLDADADVTAKLGSQDAISLAKARGHHDVAELIRAFKKQDGNK